MEPTMINNNHNVSSLNNVLIMDIEELHPAWTMYAVDFMPSQPGPLRLVIRIKAKDNHCEDDRKHVHEGMSNANPGHLLDSDTTMVEELLAKSTNKKPLYPAKPVKILKVHVHPSILDSNGKVVPNTSPTQHPVITYRTLPADAAFAAAVSDAQGTST
ncbi:hypothetical protein HYDPIDRAFT_23735 [Hydnomerulius pinastri MD-312]|nr:hypothetical protein HYDPIDRAFT_23735 [Hydnomerulius pinastri MD-312]